MHIKTVHLIIVPYNEWKTPNILKNRLNLKEHRLLKYLHTLPA